METTTIRLNEGFLLNLPQKPNNVLESTLMHLDPVSIIQTSMACKGLHAFIQSSAILQRKIILLKGLLTAWRSSFTINDPYKKAKILTRIAVMLFKLKDSREKTCFNIIFSTQIQKEKLDDWRIYLIKQITDQYPREVLTLVKTIKDRESKQIGYAYIMKSFVCTNPAWVDQNLPHLISDFRDEVYLEQIMKDSGRREDTIEKISDPAFKAAGYLKIAEDPLEENQMVETLIQAAKCASQIKNNYNKAHYLLKIIQKAPQCCEKFVKKICEEIILIMLQDKKLREDFILLQEIIPFLLKQTIFSETARGWVLDYVDFAKSKTALKLFEAAHLMRDIVSESSYLLFCEALGWIQQNPNFDKQIDDLIRIAQSLNPFNFAYHQQILQIIHSGLNQITDKEIQDKAKGFMAIQLATTQPKEATGLAEEIQNDYLRAKTLSDVSESIYQNT